MDIIEIMEMYGKNDYYEMLTGRTLHLSQMYYDVKIDCTVIPVTRNGVLMGNIFLKGDHTK